MVQYLMSRENASRLKFFHCQGEFIYEYCISEAPSLVSALIGMYFLDDGAKRQAAYRAHKLLEGLSNVKDLHVSCLNLEVLSVTEELFPRLPVFHNLNQLEFSNGRSEPVAARTGLRKILQNSPHLESIYFASRVCLSMFSAGDGWQLDPVPPCFLTHLKTIKFEVFHEFEEALNALKVIHKSARALEKIDLGSIYENRTYNALLDLVKEMHRV
ncbi:hypothetical protein PTKIN_Ptkin14bG0224900 [Pterospermum kingtungense]